jgi:hypothetical protein
LVEELIPLAVSYEEIGLRGFRHKQVLGLKLDLIKVFQNLSEFDRQLSQQSIAVRAPKLTRKSRPADTRSSGRLTTLRKPLDASRKY